MYKLRSFTEGRYERINSIIDGIGGHITSYINLIGSATLPLPEVCEIGVVPATACRVEGYIGQRFFPATGAIDEAERLAIDETRRIFQLSDDYEVNVQPHSATQANHAAIRAALATRSGPVAGLVVTDGGHISHRFGAPNTSGFVGLPANEKGIDYQRVRQVVVAEKPSIIIIGGSSYTNGVDYACLREIADLGNSHLHADLAHIGPFVAAGIHPAAFPYVDSATVDPSKNLRGSSGGILVYRQRYAKVMNRSVFPILQSSPNQSGLLGKAACLSYWSRAELSQYAERLVYVAQTMEKEISRKVGPPVYGVTTSHLLLFDVSKCGIDGRSAEERLERARILVNRNQVPGDLKPPHSPSGIRLSSTIPTIVGYSDSDVAELGRLVGGVLVGETDVESSIAKLIASYHKPLGGG